MKNILQLGKSVSIATFAQVSGRMANVAIPLVVIAAAGATPQTDRFFFILAVSFYFYGVLANAITQATVPLIISEELPLQSKHVILCGLSITIIVSTAAWVVSQLFIYIPLPYVAATGLLSGAGIANGLAASGWQAREHYIVPGLSWALRLIPLVLWWLLDSHGRHLAWLAVGIGMTDGLRCFVMLMWRSPLQRQIPVGVDLTKLKSLIPTYGMVIGAALVSGLNPIIDRIIAGRLGDAGAISILETGERIYLILSGLTTIGIATVLLPRLSRNVAENTLAENWTDVLKFTGIWCLAWLITGWMAGFWGFKWWLNNATGLTAVQSGAAQWVYWCYLMGLPFFALALVYVKRLQALQRWRVMVFTSCIGVAVNIPASLVLFRVLGVPGIALATTSIYLLNCTILMIVAHRGNDR